MKKAKRKRRDIEAEEEGAYNWKDEDVEKHWETRKRSRVRRIKKKERGVVSGIELKICVLKLYVKVEKKEEEEENEKMRKGSEEGSERGVRT